MAMARLSPSSTTGSSSLQHSISTAATSISMNAPIRPQIKTLKACDTKAAALCLAEAFSTDLICRYFLDCPDTLDWPEERKWDLHLKIMEGIVFAHVKCGLVHAIGKPTTANNYGFDAVALWMPPGTTMDGMWPLIRHGIWKHVLGLSWKLSKEGWKRLVKEFFPLLHETKVEVLKERDPSSYYLVYLGTHSSARGKGYGSRLVRKITDQVSSNLSLTSI